MHGGQARRRCNSLAGGLPHSRPAWQHQGDSSGCKHYSLRKAGGAPDSACTGKVNLRKGGRGEGTGLGGRSTGQQIRVRAGACNTARRPLCCILLSHALHKSCAWLTLTPVLRLSAPHPCPQPATSPVLRTMRSCSSVPVLFTRFPNAPSRPSTAFLTPSKGAVHEAMRPYSVCLPSRL